MGAQFLPELDSAPLIMTPKVIAPPMMKALDLRPLRDLHPTSSARRDNLLSSLPPCCVASGRRERRLISAALMSDVRSSAVTAQSFPYGPMPSATKPLLLRLAREERRGNEISHADSGEGRLIWSRNTVGDTAQNWSPPTLRLEFSPLIKEKPKHKYLTASVILKRV